MVLYNLKIWKQSIFSVKLTKVRAIISIILPLLFIGIPYFTGENSLKNYVLAVLASLFIISAMVGEGIHERGIYYHPSGINFLFAKLVKWEEIKDIELDINKSKLESIKLKTRTIFPDQYYHSKDVDEISEYLQLRIKEH